MALLQEIGLINLEVWVTLTGLVAVLAVGFGLEYRYNSKSGSYYVACAPKK